MSALPAASAAAAAAGSGAGSGSSASASGSSGAAPAKVIRVGNYKLGKTLGIGSFCKVKLATHEPTGAKVAIKILNRKKLKKQDMGDKVRTEIHILRQFSHPHIIRLYECIDSSTDIFQVLEYAPNGELFDYIVSRGKLDEAEARTLFQQIVSGIEYCIAEGTRVNLASGLAVPIEQLAEPHLQGTMVMARSDDHGEGDDGEGEGQGLVARALDRLLVRGVKACVELLFSDGRLLTCTGDHRILTAEGEWVQADQLKLGQARVAVGVEFPLHDMQEDATQDADWTMHLGTLGCTLDMRGQRERALAFARVLGLMHTDATSLSLDSDGSMRAWVSLECQMDARALQRDVLLLATEAAQWSLNECDGSLLLPLPPALTQAMLDVGMRISPSSSSTLTSSPCSLPSSERAGALPLITALPPFLLDPSTPRSLVREFLAGLFGGQGRAPELDHATTPAQVQLTDVSLALRGNDDVVMAQLLALLSRCGIDLSFPGTAAAPILSTHTPTPIPSDLITALPASLTTHSSPSHPQPQPQPHSQLLIPSSLLLSFHESIGFRYASTKQLRLTGAAMFHRACATVARQCAEVRAVALPRVARDSFNSESESASVSAAVAAAKGQLARTQLLHPDVLSWVPTSMQSLENDRIIMDLDSALDSFDMRKLFLSSSSASSSLSAAPSKFPLPSPPLGALDAIPPSPLPAVAAPARPSSTSESLPLFQVQLVGRRDVGDRRVYDLSVPSRADRFDSFTANAIVVHNCLVGSTSVALANGFSLPIRDVSVGTPLLSFDESQRGHVLRSTSALLHQGVKHCVELLFSDGRTVTCTPDHRFRDVGGKWVEAGQMELGRTEIVVGTEYPALQLPSPDAQQRAWTLQLPSLPYELNMGERRSHTLAFAGLLGHLFAASGSTGAADSLDHACALVLDHRLDAEWVQRDIHLLMGADEVVATPLNHPTRVTLPLALHLAMLHVGVDTTRDRSVAPVHHFPAFLLDAACPAAVVQSFLGGLFGAVGVAPALDRDEQDAKTRRLSEIRLSCVGVSHAAAATYTEQLQKLFQRVGMRPHAIYLANDVDAQRDGDRRRHDSALSWRVHRSDTLAFSECIGFRYSCHKQMRLTAAASYYRLQGTLQRQQQFLHTHVRKQTGALPASEAVPSPSALAGALAAAQEALRERECAHPLIDGYQASEWCAQNDDDELPGMGIDETLRSFDALHFFDEPGHTLKADAGLRCAELPVVDEAKQCGIAADSTALPTFRVKLLSRREVGPQEVFDLTVPDTHNFQAQGLCAHNCHVHGVVHRDLKPENLLLDSENRIKIADFGLSNRMKDGQFLKTSCGSPNYAAPEVISGNLYAGAEVDAWSCGVILYALLCGSLPFDDENIRALFRKIKGGIYSIPSHVSPGARDLLSKMLVVDPLKRMSISQVMQHAWYRQHLPLYLSLSAEQQIAQTQALDETVIAKVVAMGYTRERLLKSLSVGHELLTSRKYANQTEARRMAVIYNLLRDNKRRKEQSLDECVDATAGRPKDSANNVADLSEDTTGMSPFAAATTKLLVQQHLQHQADVRHAAANPHLPSSLPLLGGRWQLGISSNLDAQSIMNEVYRILRKFNFEWKVLSLYKLKARYPAGLVDRNGKPVSSAEVCKIGIQLYKVGGRDGGGVGMPGASAANSTATTPTQSPALGPISPASASSASSGVGGQTLSPEPQGAFVIDMQKLAGQMFLALELTSAIIAMASHIHPNAHLLNNSHGNSHMQ